MPTPPWRVQTTWTIAGVGIAVDVGGETGPLLTSQELERRLGAFARSGPGLDPPAARLTLCTDWGPWPRHGDALIRRLRITPDPDTPERWTLARTDIDARLDAADAHLHGALAPIGVALEECARLMLWRHLSAPNSATPGLLVHCACAVDARGVAWCFPAHSGTGKSTLIANTPGQLALNDELAVLTCHDGAWRAWPSPFWNWDAQAPADLNPQRSWPLGGIGFLAQAPETRFEPLDPGVASVLLMEQLVAFDAFADHTQQAVSHALALADALNRPGFALGRLHLKRAQSPFDTMQAAARA